MSTVGAHQTTFGGIYDGFLVKFNSSMVRQWSTYYGGTGAEFAGGRLDPHGNILLYCTTGTSSGTAIATPGSYKPTYGGGTMDLAIIKFTANGKRLWGTYYGGGSDEGGSIALDSLGKLYITGYTKSTGGIATPGSHQPFRGGGDYDGFVVKFDYCSPPVPEDATPAANRTICAGERAILLATSSGTINWYNSDSGGTSLSSGNTYTTDVLSTGSYSFFADAATCAPGELRTMVTVTVAECTNLKNYSSDEHSIRAFPNPFSSKLTLISNAKENLQVKIFSATGAVVYESQIASNEEIDLSHLPSGIYILQAGIKVCRVVRE